MKLLAQLPQAPPPSRSPMLDRLGLTDKAIDQRDVIWERKRAFGKDAVGESEDLTRILALPRRPRPTEEQQKQMAAVMTAVLRLSNPHCRCKEISSEPCITELLPIQGWYLYEASQLGGSLGHVVVGGGKTGIDILLAMVVPGCEKAVLMLPSSLREQFRLDHLRWSQHFRTPNLAGSNGLFFPDRPTLALLTYEELSNPGFSTWLKSYKPTVLIGDEVQKLKDKTSVRTDRFLRYFIENPEAEGIRFFPHSGTLTTDDLDDYCHLSALSLRENSPVPLETKTVAEWARCLNPPKKGGGAAPMGALRALCAVGETAREGFARRLVETPGVITTEDATLPTKLVLKERDPGKIPDPITEALKHARKDRERPDGETLIEALEIATCCTQLAYGFFYRWKYPRGEPAELIDEWFRTRQAWFRELRDKLERRTDLLDSPKLCEDAARRFHAPAPDDDPSLPVWESMHWPAWNAIEKQVQPVTETIWIDDFLVRDAYAWMKTGEPGIVWYKHSAFGRALAKLSGAPRYGQADAPPENLSPTPAMLERRASLMKIPNGWEGGDIAQNWIKTEDGSRAILCSIRAHGTGRNLQAFPRALIANMPDSTSWEQLLGRLHRRHQKAPTVEFQVYQHTPELKAALDDAVEAAKYVQETQRKAEKLLFAEWKIKRPRE